MKLKILTAFILIFIGINEALAARLGVVDVDRAVVRENPDLTSKVIQNLAKGTQIAVSNEPTRDFHKVRTPSGVLGWMATEDLVIRNPEGTLKSDQNEVPPMKKGFEKKINPKPSLVLRVLGGMDFFNSPAVIVNFPTLSQSMHYGAEFLIYLTDRLGWVTRGEYLFKSLSLTDVASGNSYQISLNSLPLMTGLEYGILGNHISVHFGLLGGVAFPTQIQAFAVATPTSVDQFSVNHLTALAKADLNWQFSKVLSSFLEVGYRYSQTPTLGPPTATNILQSSFIINWGGLEAGLGLALTF